MPKHLRHLFQGKTEYIQAFNTKSHDIALIELAKTNEWFDKRVTSNGYTRKKKSGVLPREQVKEIITDLENTGLHPDQQPEVNVHTSGSDLTDMTKDALDAAIAKVKLDKGEISKEEYLTLLEPLETGKMWQLKAFQAQREFLLDHLYKKYTNHDNLSGPVPVVGDDDFPPPQLKWDESDPEVIKYRIMNGDPVNPAATWQNALDTYLHYNLQKRRNPEQTIKHQTAAVSMANKLATAFPKRMDTPLIEVEKFMIEDFCNAVWPNAATRDRNLRTLAAIWRSWDVHNEKEKVGFDPFKSIIKLNADKLATDTIERRALTPAEFQHFNKSILDEPKAEIKLIGMIMAYCGAPTGEAAGLTRGDIKLNASTPYMVFRNNKVRVMGKDRLERAVPFIHSGIKLQIYPLFTYLKQYLGQKDLEPDDLVFPEYACGKYVSSYRTKVLSNHISNMRSGYDSRQAVPYSLRHTFKDRYEAAGVPAQVGEYIMGHKTKQSSKVHSKYGTGMPIQMLVDYITDITEVQDHGFFEEYD
ncbi:tyrosine-type recombinase/integrase [Planktomarina sp.]|nr:tyrosine-type recombinase/integrase [Planktomarina sp.]